MGDSLLVVSLRSRVMYAWIRENNVIVQIILLVLSLNVYVYGLCMSSLPVCVYVLADVFDLYNFNCVQPAEKQWLLNKEAFVIDIRCMLCVVYEKIAAAETT